MKKVPNAIPAAIAAASVEGAIVVDAACSSGAASLAIRATATSATPTPTNASGVGPLTLEEAPGDRHDRGADGRDRRDHPHRAAGEAEVEEADADDPGAAGGRSVGEVAARREWRAVDQDEHGRADQPDGLRTHDDRPVGRALRRQPAAEVGGSVGDGHGQAQEHRHPGFLAEPSTSPCGEPAFS